MPEVRLIVLMQNISLSFVHTLFSVQNRDAKSGFSPYRTPAYMFSTKKWLPATGGIKFAPKSRRS